MSKKKKIGFGILGTVAALIIIALNVPSTTETPTPPPEPTLPEVQTPSEAQTPSETQQLAEQAYASLVKDHVYRGYIAMDNLGDLMSDPLIGEVEWTLDVAAQLVVIQSLYDEATDISPPSSMAASHQKYVQAFSHYNAATYLIAQGIDELDYILLEQAIEEMELGTQALDEATKLLP